MPFGLCNGPATYQKCMDSVLNGLLYKSVTNYVDDTLVYSPSFDQHLIDLEKVISRVGSVGLTLNIKKCKFALQEVEILGHELSPEGLHPQKERIQKIQEIRPPTNVPEARSFIGMIGYYRQFIKDFSIIAAPITNLFRKNRPWKWNAQCQQAFTTLIDRIRSAPILASPDFTKPFILTTDASTIGLGAVLSQIGQDQKEHPIAFISRRISDAESRYGATKLELLAVKWAVEHFHHYLSGQHFTIVTDHSALTWLLSTAKMPTDNVFSRWITMLQGYDFEIRHRPGKENRVADALSRLVK